jgi:hypothetical protein
MTGNSILNDVMFPMFCMGSGMVVMYIWMKYGK